MSGILNQDDRDVIVLASLIRGGIKCIKTNERKCGYQIRPELWFTVMKPGAQRALETHGVAVRLLYSDTEEITKILNIINGLEDLSPTDYGLNTVRDLNGIIEQPRNHEEVIKVLDILDEYESVHNPNRIRKKPEEGE
tara:strand:+ start:2309 stop:2722 length:414 start_codon:yes stop_codon:yes gene_type:complete